MMANNRTIIGQVMLVRVMAQKPQRRLQGGSSHCSEPRSAASIRPKALPHAHFARKRRTRQERGGKARWNEHMSDALYDLTLVVPCYNGQITSRCSTKRPPSASEQAGVDIEIVFVNDGSQDGTAQLCGA